MGVLKFYSTLIQQYPDILNYTKLNNFNNLYLDTNCLIHPMVHKVLSEIKEKISEEQLLKKFFLKIENYIIYLFKHVNPNKLLYIAIDGTCPRAKMQQQRLRRFKSIKEKNRIKEVKTNFKVNIKNNINFDTNAITPGTQFMEKLSKYLKKFISNCKLFENIKVILSDASEEGEGEHKILQHIKGTEQNENSSIYGLDADLIFLSLASKQKNIYLLREPVHYGIADFDSLIYLNIDELKEVLFKNITKYIQLDKTKLHKDKIIDDYIILMFLFGNDFIPSLNSLKINNKTIEKVLIIYSKILSNLEEYLFYESEINDKFLKCILKILSSTENDMLHTINNNYNRRIYFKKKEINSKKFLEKELLKLQCKPIFNQNKNTLLKNKNYEQFYFRIFNIKGLNNKKITEICKNYLEGLKWTAKYYFDKCCDWDWYYKFSYAPSVTDIYKNFNFSFNSISFNNSSKPCKEIEQLLMVLPPQSSHLIPKKHQYLMTKYESPIIFYYPIKFKIEFENKFWYHECFPKLPNINFSKIKNLNLN